MVASVEQNHEELLDHFSIAIRLMPHDIELRKHHFLSLFIAGLTENAFNAAIQAAEMSPGDPDLLDRVLVASLLVGRFREGKVYLDRWRKIRPDQEHIRAEFVDNVSSFMAEHKISDDSIAEIYRIAHEVSHGHHQPHIETVEHTIAGDDEYEWIQAFFAIRGSIDEVVAINVKLAIALAKLDPPPARSDLVSVMFVPAVENADHA